MACASVIRPAQVSLQYETAAMCLLSKVLCLTRVPLVKENRHRLRFLLPASTGVPGFSFSFFLKSGKHRAKRKAFLWMQRSRSVTPSSLLPSCGCRGQSPRLLCFLGNSQDFIYTHSTSIQKQKLSSQVVIFVHKNALSIAQCEL